MKRFTAILLILVLLFALSGMALAAAVDSPEHDNTNPDVTEDPVNPSPQTGEQFNVVWVILAAVLAGGVVLFCGKKLLSK